LARPQSGKAPHRGDYRRGTTIALRPPAAIRSPSPQACEGSGRRNDESDDGSARRRRHESGGLTRERRMYTLGINAAYHDTPACLVRDGAVVAAAEDERFTRIKHGKRPVLFTAWELPYHAIDYCLAEAGIKLADVDHVAYAYDPFLLL